jgi:guanylate kinase
VIVLLGESGCGKSKISKQLEALGYHRIVTYTTREPRIEDGELNGVDYFFLSDDEFMKLKEESFFGETGEYRMWHYGSGINSYTIDSTIALTPKGLRQLKRRNVELKSFYISVPRRERLIKILERGDDIDESYRRSVSDIGQFDGIEDEVDYVIDNTGCIKTPMEIASVIKILDNGGSI